MKRWAGILLAAALSIACCACSMQKPELSVAPSSFSRETTEVLRPFQSELQFVDLKLNEDAKQWKISLWSYRDGEWKEQGKMFEKVKQKSESLRIAIRLTTKECDLYLMDGQQIEAGDLIKDFRNCPCTAGAAVTVTILDEEPQEQQE